MSCFISSGYLLDCRNASTGGLNTIWLLGDAGSTISGFTENANEQILSASGSGTLYKFQLTKQGSSFVEELGINTTAQSVVFQPTLVMNLPKLDFELRLLFQNLVNQNSIVGCFLDNNNRFFTFAWRNGALVTAGSISSGMGYTDLNGLSALTMQGGEPNATQEIVVTTNLQDVFTGINVQL